MSEPTICAECHFCEPDSSVDGKEKAALWAHCMHPNSGALDFVTGERRLDRCRNRNPKGKCPDFEKDVPRPQKQPQAPSEPDHECAEDLFQRRAKQVAVALGILVWIVIALLFSVKASAAPMPMSLHPVLSPVCTEAAVETCGTLLDTRQAAVDPWTGWTACLEAASFAERHGAPVDLAVALAYRESTLNPWAVSRVGAIGTMQIMPQFWCLEGCHPTEAGIFALLSWMHGADDWTHAIARYNAGWHPGSVAYAWAETVVALADTLGGKL